MTRSPAALVAAVALVVGCSYERSPDDRENGVGGFGGAEAEVSSTRAAATSTWTGIDYPPCRSCEPEPDGRERCGPFQQAGDCSGGDCGGCGEGQQCIGDYCDPPATCDFDVSPHADCNLCLRQSCCSELGTCAEPASQCLAANGDIDPTSSEGARLKSCLVENCVEECSRVCGVPGTTTYDPRLDACISDACCVELEACTAGGQEVDACIECLQEPGGPRCDDYFACAVAECGSCGFCSTACGATFTSFDYVTDACLSETCCEAIEECEAAEGDCWYCYETPDHPGCEALFDCIDACRAGEICTSNVQVEPRLAACLSNTCCQEFYDCSLSGTDVAGCEACLVAGGGERCDAALLCMEACLAPLPSSICDSHIAFADPGGCVTDACCEAFRACSSDGDTRDECNDCIDAGGGPYCDAALACAAESCPPLVSPW